MLNAPLPLTLAVAGKINPAVQLWKSPAQVPVNAPVFAVQAPYHVKTGDELVFVIDGTKLIDASCAADPSHAENLKLIGGAAELVA